MIGISEFVTCVSVVEVVSASDANTSECEMKSIISGNVKKSPKVTLLLRTSF
jgi:hypothetical protein